VIEIEHKTKIIFNLHPKDLTVLTGNWGNCLLLLRVGEKSLEC